jgi:hypothetical protein
MGTKGENDDDINGRLGRAQSSPKKLVTKFPVSITLDSNMFQDKWQIFCNSATIKANVKDEDVPKSAQRQEGMWKEQGYNATCFYRQH